jgi:hypothetical protein
MKGRQRRCGKEACLNRRKHLPEQRWPEQDACEHFADHRRLSKAPECERDQAAGRDDHEQLKEEDFQERASVGSNRLAGAASRNKRQR